MSDTVVRARLLSQGAFVAIPAVSRLLTRPPMTG